MSHPSWVCGLKQEKTTKNQTFLRHTLRGCVDWNSPIFILNLCRASHTLRGCVDWNILQRTNVLLQPSHTLRGCVDWNKLIQTILIEIESHTLRGCVDWNLSLQPHKTAFAASHPSWVCGLKLENNCFFLNLYTVTPFVGVWIETLIRAA